ncbi:MAG: hypothetical protein BV457_06415 [Thermoplasmata archaeon M9B1D]|nr:MAG: hypothetical protein BV457_06415 [Thermoplasmata archaeon M9B1D]PNX48217.1 MAG: hypothetical protein BV456_10045 [Thermoplasmata archaeon M8B2D]
MSTSHSLFYRKLKADNKLVEFIIYAVRNNGINYDLSSAFTWAHTPCYKYWDKLYFSKFEDYRKEFNDYDINTIQLEYPELFI